MAKSDPLLPDRRHRGAATGDRRGRRPRPGQARVRHTAIAVNFIDIYFRTGRYPLALPNGLGSDAVGVVEAVG
jgi:NADPH:quinone reductase-like Zn-dependent oxidoreductase